MDSHPDKPPLPVGRRLVLYFPGFESMPVEAHCRRFIRELRKTAPVYGFCVPAEIPVSASTPDTATAVRGFEIAADGEGWTTKTEVVVYGLEDLHAGYAAGNPLVRLLRGLSALADFALSGTVFRYVATSWRYSLFFLYPVAVVTGVLLTAYLVFSGIDALFGKAGFPWAVAAGFSIAGLMLWLASRRMHLLLIMDDWSFARDIARGRRPEIRTQLDAMAADAARRMAAANADEIVFAAHSFGAITAVQVLASLVQSDWKPTRPCGLLAVGSSLLKVALHPAATQLRAAVETVVRSGCPWLDVQSLTDPMNFYRTDPPRVLGIHGGRPVRTMLIRFRHQLSPQTYRSIRRNFFRVHRQFVYGVERRSRYSFHAVLCGPEAFYVVAGRPGLSDSWSGRGRARTDGRRSSP